VTRGGHELHRSDDILRGDLVRNQDQNDSCDDFELYGGDCSSVGDGSITLDRGVNLTLMGLVLSDIV